MNITEKTKVIVEFLKGRCGKVDKNLYTFKGLYGLNNGDTWITLEDCEFHNNWNWIMFVIDEIESNYNYKHNENKGWYIDNFSIGDSMGKIAACYGLHQCPEINGPRDIRISKKVYDNRNSKIITVFQVVVETIQWIEKQKENIQILK